MRRLLPRVLNVIAALSAVACVALAVQWVRSFEPAVWRATTDRGYFLLIMLDPDTSGTFMTDAALEAPDHSMRWVYRYLEGNGAVTQSRQALGFATQTGMFDANAFNRHPSQTSGYSLVQAPMWPFIVAAAVLPAARLLAYRRRRKNAGRGLCRRCGYDLRATPKGDGALLARCPECGVPSNTPPAAGEPAAPAPRAER